MGGYNLPAKKVVWFKERKGYGRDTAILVWDSLVLTKQGKIIAAE